MADVKAPLHSGCSLDFRSRSLMLTEVYCGLTYFIIVTLIFLCGLMKNFTWSFLIFSIIMIHSSPVQHVIGTYLSSNILRKQFRRP